MTPAEMMKRRSKAEETAVLLRRKEKLAINIADLTRLEPLVVGMLKLKEHLDRNNVVWADKNKGDEQYVVFRCNLLMAGTICDIIRHRDRKEKEYPTRVVICRDVAWERITSGEVLTVVRNLDDGKGTRCLLNPKLFKNVFEAQESEELPAVRFD